MHKGMSKQVENKEKVITRKKKNNKIDPPTKCPAK